MAGEADTFLFFIVAIIFPPAAAAFVAGCGADLCINILLTMLGYLPGCIHAFWLVIKRAEANSMYGYNNWTYVGMGEYVPRQQYPHPGARVYDRGGPPPPPEAQPAPPPTQPPASTVSPPSAPAPVDPKAGYVPPPQPPTDQKYTSSTSGDQAPHQPPAYQKQADPPAQSTAAPTGGA